MALREISVPFRLIIWLLSVSLAGTVASPTLAVAANSAPTGPRSGLWAHEGSALKPDPNVVWGRLDNGFRYALLPHHGLPGRVSVQLLVFTGSLDETDEEQGIAHFTEHMVFRTTKNFGFEEKLRYFQQLGMEFGSDVNANTGHERTAFELDFHEVTPELLFQGLRVLRDIADGAKFLPEEINKERGVVLSELRDNDTLASGNADYTWPIAFKGLTAAQRFPIGKRETLQAMTHEHFARFYERCYRTDLMVLVVAGDFESDKLVALIRERFGDMVRPAGPVPPRNDGKLDTTRGLRAGVFSISAVGNATGDVMCVMPTGEKSDSAEMRADTLRRTVAMDIVADRLHTLGGGQAGFARIFGHNVASVEAEISPDDWARELGVLDDLVRFTALKGFEQREVDMVKRRYAVRNSYLLEQKDALDPKGLAENLAESISEHQVYIGYEAALRASEATLAGVNPRNLLQAFQSCWDFDRMAFLVAGEVEIEGGGTEVVKKVLEARKGGLRNFRPETRKESVFELKTWGPPSSVVERREVPELGATLFRFGNNVHVNFVHNRSAAGQVHVLARVGTGLLDLPDNRPALKDFGLESVIYSGSANYTPEYIGKIYEDHLTYLSIDLDDQDAFAFRAGTTKDKIEIPLGIFTDFLHRPQFNTTLHREVKLMAYMRRGLNSFSMGEAMTRMNDHLFKGDPRLASGGPKDYLRLSAVDVRNWLEEPLEHGYVELTIVGDITEEAMLTAVGHTFACLPARVDTKILLAPPRPIKVTAPAGFERIEFVGEQNLALVIGTWPVQAPLSLRDKMALYLVSRILQDRIMLSLRADLGLSYAPSADFTPFNGFGDFAVVRAYVACAPDKSSKIAELVDTIGAALGKDGIPADEFVGAQRLLLGQMRESFRDGSFLLSMIKRAQEKPASLDEVIALKNGSIGEISLAEVNAWTTKVLNRKNCRTAAIVPKPFIGVFQPGQ